MKLTVAFGARSSSVSGETGSPVPWKPISDPPKGWLSKNREPRAKFLVDESLGAEVADALRGAGWNAVFAGDLGLLGRSDEDVFAAACREDRILLTHDRDFLNDRIFRPDRNPGLVVLPGADGEERTLIPALGGAVSIIGCFRETWRGSKVVIHADGTWTVWHRTEGGRVRRTQYRFPLNRRVEEWVDGE